MPDVLYILIVIAFFALHAGLVNVLDRFVISRPAATDAHPIEDVAVGGSTRMDATR